MPSASIQISNKLLGDVMTTAFEGGSVGWCISANPSKGHIDTSSSDPWYAQSTFWGDTDFEIAVVEVGDDEHTVTWSSFQKNFRLFADKFPSSLARIKEEQYDAVDADRLWQFIVFGELVYG